MESELSLLKFPQVDNIYRERVRVALECLEDPNEEMDALNGIFEGLVEFFDTLDSAEAEMISYELQKIQYYTQVTYDNWT
jgi:hypothetical protein